MPRILDHAVIDPQIAAMRAEKKSVAMIAATLGIGMATVSSRINVNGWVNVKRGRRPAKRAYKPTEAELETLAAILATAAQVKRKTGAPSGRIISSIHRWRTKGS